jgi:hypothetical protein
MMFSFFSKITSLIIRKSTRLKIDCDSRISLGIEEIENVFSMKNLFRRATKSFSLPTSATFVINSIIESIKPFNSVTVFFPTFLMSWKLNLSFVKILSLMFRIFKFPFRNEVMAFLLLFERLFEFI